LEEVAWQVQHCCWSGHRFAKCFRPSHHKDREEESNGSFFLDPTKGPVFQNITQTVSTAQSLTKAEKWESTKEVLKKWSQDELDSMLQSGRYISRECPWSPGVWEYQDTQRVERSQTMVRNKSWGRKHESDMKPESKQEDDEAMAKMWGAASNASTFNDRAFWGQCTEEGHVSGSFLGYEGKGKGKGKQQKALPGPRGGRGMYCSKKKWFMCCHTSSHLFMCVHV
jgi:hypothetical protein